MYAFTKTRMRKSRNSRLAAALALLVASGGCATSSHFLGGQATQPVQLIGEWVDSLHTSAADTALWVLRADGQDLSVHLAPDSASRGAGRIVSSRRHGVWYLQGSLADTASRALCFNSRPGRSAPSCVPFSLDSLSHPSRLEVFGYQGEHRTAARVLFRRVLR